MHRARQRPSVCGVWVLGGACCGRGGRRGGRGPPSRASRFAYLSYLPTAWVGCARLARFGGQRGPAAAPGGLGAARRWPTATLGAAGLSGASLRARRCRWRVLHGVHACGKKLEILLRLYLRYVVTASTKSVRDPFYHMREWCRVQKTALRRCSQTSYFSCPGL